MSLDPRHLPHGYAELLQDIINIRDKLMSYDSTQARVMVDMLGVAVLVAESQLDHMEQAAMRRMLSPV